MQKKKISLISNFGEFESIAVLLLDERFQFHSFSGIPSALESSALMESDVVLIDTPQPEGHMRKLFSRLRRRNGKCRAIAAWAPGDSLDPDLIPCMYKILRKPVSASVLKNAVVEATEADFPFEARREIRMPAELEMDLITNSRILKMETRNVSLHGMQAAWGYEWGFNEAREIAESECRIYFGKWIKKYIQIPVRFCYAAGSPSINASILLGFEFGELETTQQELLYRVAGCKNIW